VTSGVTQYQIIIFDFSESPEKIWRPESRSQQTYKLTSKSNYYTNTTGPEAQRAELVSLTSKVSLQSPVR